ncbi:hypothetical protein LPJ53_000947 [Coemansia erecta]|uniref:Uncharacterized protein n=1 Tax=Coemansia erecta TaxID=147472 RepID=A0A9W8CUL6_9FUNG|nr:hypothetical protein LPJ53_000947 [Coemansia erecta]
MSAAQPFPVLASADNSRAGSPAPSAGSPGGQKGGRGKGKGKGGSKQAPRGKENGAAAADKAVAGDKPAAGDKATAAKPRHKKPKSKAKDPAAAAAAVEQQQQQGSETSGSSSNGGSAGRGGKGRGKKRQDTGAKAAAPAESAPAPESPTSATDDSGRRPKKAGKGSQRRRTVANPASSTATSAQPSPTQPASQPSASRATVSLARSSSSGALPLAMIVAGENGRARVLFSPQGVDNDHPLAHTGMSPRFSAGAVHSARSSAQNGRMLHSAYGDGLGLRSPMSPATHAHTQAPGLLRQRSLTSTHHHAAEPQWHGHHPQHQQQHWHGQQWHGQQQQHGHQWHGPQDVPLSAPEPRGRSQSMHMSMTGLRISLAQSRPGNVLSPHIALPPRSANAAAAGVQTNTYANNGYFATRRASLSNVGLAVDPSHSIRIPTIMFEKPKPEDLARASAQKTAATAAKDEAETDEAAAGQGGAPPTPVSAEDGSAGEMLAMQRLQEMIASMRKISQPQAAKKPEPVALAGDAPGESADSGKNAAVQMPPTPAAHPTSRFDSILEEDEDGEDDEAILDEEEPKTSAASAAAASAAAPALLTV